MNTKAIKKLMEKVNDYWLTQKPESGSCDWERGVYFIGCLAAYRVTKKQSYLDYALRWANKHNWHFQRHELGNSYRNADCKTCSQSYFELMDMCPGEGTYKNMLEEMEFILNDPACDYWHWVDTIFMAFPVYHMFGVKFDDDRYFEKAHALFTNTKSERSLYDQDEHMWFRDEKYLPEKMLTSNGKKIFWGRGNGWILAGLARGLMMMPEDLKYRSEYMSIYLDMCKALVRWQQPDGFWRCSIIDPTEYDIPETSGTLLITYGLALGILLGYIDRDTYYPYVEKGFDSLCSIAVDKNGKIGYVQDVEQKPGPVYKDTTKDYAVGVFLALCETMIKLDK